jgi:hypothetical protein
VQKSPRKFGSKYPKIIKIWPCFIFSEKTLKTRGVFAKIPPVFFSTHAGRQLPGAPLAVDGAGRPDAPRRPLGADKRPPPPLREAPARLPPPLSSSLRRTGANPSSGLHRSPPFRASPRRAATARSSASTPSSSSAKRQPPGSPLQRQLGFVPDAGHHRSSPISPPSGHLRRRRLHRRAQGELLVLLVLTACPRSPPIASATCACMFCRRPPPLWSLRRPSEGGAALIWFTASPRIQRAWSHTPWHPVASRPWPIWPAMASMTSC